MLSSFKSARKGLKTKFASVKEDYRWEELQELDKRRRDILKRVEDPVLKTLLRYDGTVLQILGTDPLFWITMFIYIGIRCLAHYDELPSNLDEFPVDS